MPRLAVEILCFEPHSVRARVFFKALRATAALAALAVIETTRYQGTAAWLLLWGPGAPDRFDPMRRQVAAGGHVAAFDLAYWGRDRKIRVSIDTAHPQAWVMRHDWPAARFLADHVPVSSTWNPAGPIIVAGIGRKARAQYGSQVDTWERTMIAACRARWPKHRLYYRAKQVDAPVPQHVVIMSPGAAIDRALTGASLLITWHSNVAIDAIRMGIPVVCRDGAAAAVCPAELPPDLQPLAAPLRDRFLRNLAWFQWDASEAAACWAFLQQVIT